MAAEQPATAQPGTDQLNALDALGEILWEEYNLAEKLRQPQEEIWLADLRQVRGVYDPEILKRIGPRSKANMRLTRAKKTHVNARIRDLLFPMGSKNYSVEATPVPELSQDKHLLAVAKMMNDRAMAGNPTPPTEQEALAYIRDEATRAASAMAEEIDDQLQEGFYEDEAAKVQDSAHTYGTGILKGPLTEKVMDMRWTPIQNMETMEVDYQMRPVAQQRPWFGMRQIWHIYPDPYCTEHKDAEYIWERNILTRFDLLKLAQRRGFDQAAIREHLRAYPLGDAMDLKFFEAELRLIPGTNDIIGPPKNRYQLLERWGFLSGEQLAQAGIQITPEQREESFEIHLYMLGKKVVKALVNPLPGQYRPYHWYYYDKDETSIWGQGVPRVMRDPAALFNASIRMAFDNGAISSGPQIEVNRSMLDDEEDFESVVPFRVWVRSGMPGDAQSPAIRVHNVDSHVKEHIELAKVVKDLGDEVSTTPSYTYGQPSTAAANTLGGLSILMGNISVSMKGLAGNWDGGITEPFIRAMADWNMMFNPRQDIKGDHKILGLGVKSLLAKEMRGHALEAFAAGTLNPFDAPFTKRVELLRERAKAQDLPVDKLVPTEQEIEQYKMTGIAPWVIPPPPMMPMAPPGMAPLGGPGGAPPHNPAETPVNGPQAVAG